MARREGKTEKPTAKRRRDARKKGQVARSADLVPWATLLTATFLVPVILRRVEHGAFDSLAMVQRVMEEPEPVLMLRAFHDAFLSMILALLPVFGAIMLMAIIGNIAQVGFVLTSEPLKPKLSRLNPVQGFKRLFSLRSGWELGKSILKFGVIAIVAWPTLSATVDQLSSGVILSASSFVPLVAGRTMRLVRSIAFAGLAIAAADWAFQKRQIGKDLMMTKQEIKDEFKQQEGDPQVKARIRSMQMSMTRNRMLAAVGTANVVVVNPVHLAVALSYVPGRGAPRVVAKGNAEVAERIRDEADAHDVPIVESIPLARALYNACELEQEIPVELYEAVARLLAFVQRLALRHDLGIQPDDGHHRLPEHLLVGLGA